MILFPGETIDSRKTTSLGYGNIGGSERFGTINADLINVINVVAKTVTAEWVYAGNLNANQITVGDIASDRIRTNFLATAQATITTLSAIVANLGNVVVGGDADSLGTIVVKNSSAVEIAKLNQSGIIIRNTRGLFLEGTTGGQYWDLQVDASNNSRMSLASANKFYVYDFAGTTEYLTASNDGVYGKAAGGLMGNGRTSSINDSPRVIKTGSAEVAIVADSYGTMQINFGYTFASNPYVVAVVTETGGTLGGPHEWNVGVNQFDSGQHCHAQVRNVHMATGTGTLQINWIAVGFPTAY